MYTAKLNKVEKPRAISADQITPGTLLEGSGSGSPYLRLEDNKILNLSTNKVTSADGTTVYVLPAGATVTLTAQ